VALNIRHIGGAWLQIPDQKNDKVVTSPNAVGIVVVGGRGREKCQQNQFLSYTRCSKVMETEVGRKKPFSGEGAINKRKAHKESKTHIKHGSKTQKKDHKKDGGGQGFTRQVDNHEGM